MGYENRINSFDDPNVEQSKIKFPEHESQSILNRNSLPKQKNRKKNKLGDVNKEPVNVKWLVFGCFAVALMFALITSWSSTPKQSVVKANHVQKAKYHRYKIVGEQNREARGFSKSY